MMWLCVSVSIKYLGCTDDHNNDNADNELWIFFFTFEGTKIIKNVGHNINHIMSCSCTVKCISIVIILLKERKQAKFYFAFFYIFTCLSLSSKEQNFCFFKAMFFVQVDDTILCPRSFCLFFQLWLSAGTLLLLSIHSFCSCWSHKQKKESSTTSTYYRHLSFSYFWPCKKITSKKTTHKERA